MSLQFLNIIYTYSGAVAELVERLLPVQEIGSSIPGRVKPMTFKIDTCHFLAYRLALIGWNKDSLAQCQDNVTQWDIGSWYERPEAYIYI